MLTVYKQSFSIQKLLVGGVMREYISDDWYNLEIPHLDKILQENWTLDYSAPAGAQSTWFNSDDDFEHPLLPVFRAASDISRCSPSAPMEQIRLFA